MNNTAIVVHKRSRVPYEYLGNDRYRNLHTGVEGEVGEDKAKDVFNIHLDATDYFARYPEIKNLVKTLKLRLDVGSMQI